MRHRTAVALGVAALLSSLVGTPVHAQTEAHRAGTDARQSYRAAKSRYDKAENYFVKREYEKALRELAACTATMPEYSQAHLLTAKALYMLKDHAKALESVEKAKATYGAMRAFSESLDSDRLEELRRRRQVAETGVADMGVGLARATSIEDQQRIQNQINIAKQTITDIDRQVAESFKPGEAMPAEYFFLHGNILLRLSRLAEAEPQYREALKIRPEYPEAVNNLASLYYSAGMAKAALEVLNQAETKGVHVNPELKKAVLDALK